MVTSYSFFVWYRVKAGEASEAEPLIRAMQARLACRTGIRGHLMKKRQEPDLWMETYVGIADAPAFEAQLARAVSEFDVEMFLLDERHTECFNADASPGATCEQAL